MKNTREDILKNVSNQTVDVRLLWGSKWFINCPVTDILQNIFFYLLHSYRFETTWGWV